MSKKITEQSTSEEKEQVVMDLIQWLAKQELFHDVCIYCNKKRWLSDWYNDRKENVQVIENETISPDPFYVQENINVTDYIKYANENLITMSFEGPLYHALNYGNNDIYKNLRKFFAKRGLYFELGYAWSLATYEL